jgi:redox-sensitive bicupin YhaK (pirin superfamily)
MTAGRGIVHSERTPEELRGAERRSHGLQLWVGLPEANEEDAPSFQHVAADAIPSTDIGGVRVRVLVGSAFGLSSPVRTLSPTLYLDMAFTRGAGATLTIPAAAQERALYSVDEDIEIDGVAVPARTMTVLDAGEEPVVAAPRGARVVLIGGAALGHRFMVWNFVSSRKERIVTAQDDWEAQRFDKVPGETEFIPLPPRRP